MTHNDLMITLTTLIRELSVSRTEEQAKEIIEEALYDAVEEVKIERSMEK